MKGKLTMLLTEAFKKKGFAPLAADRYTNEIIGMLSAAAFDDSNIMKQELKDIGVVLLNISERF